MLIVREDLTESRLSGTGEMDRNCASQERVARSFSIDRLDPSHDSVIDREPLQASRSGVRMQLVESRVGISE